jgi:hypothetical protein
MPRDSKIHSPNAPLNVLLTNGRFPVSLDLARQLKQAGHYVYAVDPMEFHVCKFSRSTVHCRQSAAPTEKYVRDVHAAIDDWKIDLILTVRLSPGFSR